MGSAGGLGCFGGCQPRFVYAPATRRQSHHDIRVKLPLQKTWRTELYDATSSYCTAEFLVTGQLPLITKRIFTWVEADARNHGFPLWYHR